MTVRELIVELLADADLDDEVRLEVGCWRQDAEETIAVYRNVDPQPPVTVLSA